MFPFRLFFQKAIRVYFHIRALCFELRLQTDPDLPLTKADALVKENDKLDLSKSGRKQLDCLVVRLILGNSDLIACTVHMKET